MKRVQALVVVCSSLVLTAACSSSAITGAAPTTTLRLPGQIRTVNESGLRTAALAWFHAFLYGSLNDLRAMQGPECAAPSTSTTYSQDFVSKYLQGMRAQIERHIGIPLDQIKVRGVLVRDVTPTGGDAELQYNLPVSKAGNDNWVTYALHDHRLKVADCHAPIGGSSSSATSSSPTTTPTTGRVVGTVREVGGPAPGLNRQLPGTVTATSRSGRHWHATTTATQPFSLTLPAGTYRLTGTSPLINSGQSECSALAPAVVVGDKTTHIEVVCSIR